jgi:hypothetical protein
MLYRLKNAVSRLFITGDRSLRLFNDATVWDDATFPFTSQRVNVGTGRVDYNYFNGGIDFQNNARFNEADCISFLWQVKHQVQIGINVRPHLHWLQTSANEPNWLVAWKKIKNDEAYTKETDFSNHTLATKLSNVYTYTSGTKGQITRFPEIDMSDMGLSDMIQYAFFRDVNNDSGAFAGAESSPGIEMAWEYDVHVPIDGLGSEDEYFKYSY